MLTERKWNVGDRFIYHSYYTKKNGYGTVVEVEGIKIFGALDDFQDTVVIFPSMSPYVRKIDN